jgi:YggT family protein
MSVLLVFLRLVELLLLARVILSWVASPVSREPVVVFIRSVTDPILAPIRSILPATGGFDFSPVVAFLLIDVLRGMLGSFWL